MTRSDGSPADPRRHGITAKATGLSRLRHFLQEGMTMLKYHGIVWALATFFVAVGLTHADDRNTFTSVFDVPTMTLEGDDADAETTLAHYYRRFGYRRGYYYRPSYRSYSYGYSYYRPSYRFSYGYRLPSYYSYRPYFYGYRYSYRPFYGYSYGYSYYSPRYYSYAYPQSYYYYYGYRRIDADLADDVPLVTLAADSLPCVPMPPCDPQNPYTTESPLQVISSPTPQRQPSIPNITPKAPANGAVPSYRYDGGPANPFPQGQAVPVPKRSRPQKKYLVSVPGDYANPGLTFRAYGETTATPQVRTVPTSQRSGFADPAYGERSRSSGFATDR